MAKLRIAKEIFDIFYPVGSYYETSNTSFNPNNDSNWYGTWKEDTAGRILVAIDNNDSNFNTIGKIGGANTNSTSYTPSGTVGSHTLTVDEIPAHTHTIPNGDGQRNGDNGSDWQKQGWTVNTYGKATGSAGGGKGHNHGFTGTKATINVSSLQKYIVVKRWHRTA